MTDPSMKESDDRQRAIADRMTAKLERKLKSRKDVSGVWFGLGLMGIVGWSVAIPTLLGTALGIWIDGKYPGGHPWTLALLVAGLSLGCLNAWHWVGKEEKAIRDQERNP